MNVICTDTNAVVAGFPIPQGAFEFPVHGTLGVATSSGLATNITVGTLDTLVIGPQTVQVIPGPDAMILFCGGVGLVVGVFGLAAMARRFARILTANRVGEI